MRRLPKCERSRCLSRYFHAVITHTVRSCGRRRRRTFKASENAIRFYGGAPCAIVPDNLKSAVTRSDRNEPVINADFEAFAEHYGCAVVPARARHPKDKALVENAVKLLYRTVYVDLEGMVYHDLESLNEAIFKSIASFNAQNLTRRKESRRQLFEAVEKDSLRPLPANRYQMRQRAVATVQRNSYVTLNKHHYSVPVQYVGKRVEMVYDTDTIDIFYGFTHVTTHHRNDTHTNIRRNRHTICRDAKGAARATLRNCFHARLRLTISYCTIYGRSLRTNAIRNSPSGSAVAS